MRVLTVLVFLAGCAPAPAGSGALPFDGGDTTLASGVERLARDTHRSVNLARGQQGVRTLEWSNRLADVATAHSLDMIDRGYFDHTNPEGLDPFARLQAAAVRGCPFPYENLLESTPYHEIVRQPSGAGTEETVDWWGSEELAEHTVAQWMSSPGHRRNLLRSGSRRHGIGVASDDHRVVITQVLC